MARAARLTPRYIAALARLGIRPATPVALALARTVRALLTAQRLPLPGDSLCAMPPTHTAHVRRVAGKNLWLWYRATATEVALLSVSNVPPTPIGSA